MAADPQPERAPRRPRLTSGLAGILELSAITLAMSVLAIAVAFAGALRALAAQGASGGQVFLYGVLPAAIPRFAAYGLYRWEVTIREAVVVGVVGAGGLGLLLDQQLASFDYSGVVSTLIALIVLTLMVDLVSAAIRRSLR